MKPLHSHSILTSPPTLLFLTLLLMFLSPWVSNADPADVYSADGTKSDTPKEWAIALHGGAGYVSPDMPEARRVAYEEALQEALAIGSEILEEGGSSLDAVEATVRFLEDHELFNAGKGAVFTAEGRNELDAAIMDGHTMQAGAVTGVTTVKNPVTLARRVMTDSRHVFFSGDGAEAFANGTDVERVDPSYFYTESRFEALRRVQEAERDSSPGDDSDEKGGSGAEVEPGAEPGAEPDANHDSQESSNESLRGWKYGTVGAVAKDREGRLASATSTGGMTNKRYGRVGDVPIIGSGTYANKDVAVSATGWGEKIMLHVSAHTLASHYRFTGASLQESMDYLVDEVLEPGDAGFIAVDRTGAVSMKTNTGSMFRAAADSEGLREVAIW
jgi:beta-aspartyl-peptidase (threonine type)